MSLTERDWISFFFHVPIFGCCQAYSCFTLWGGVTLKFPVCRMLTFPVGQHGEDFEAQRDLCFFLLALVTVWYWNQQSNEWHWEKPPGTEQDNHWTERTTGTNAKSAVCVTAWWGQSEPRWMRQQRMQFEQTQKLVLVFPSPPGKSFKICTVNPVSVFVCHRGKCEQLRCNAPPTQSA